MFDVYALAYMQNFAAISTGATISPYLSSRTGLWPTYFSKKKRQSEGGTMKLSGRVMAGGCRPEVFRCYLFCAAASGPQPDPRPTRDPAANQPRNERDPRATYLPDDNDDDEHHS